MLFGKSDSDATDIGVAHISAALVSEQSPFCAVVLNE